MVFTYFRHHPRALQYSAFVLSLIGSAVLFNLVFTWSTEHLLLCLAAYPIGMVMFTCLCPRSDCVAESAMAMALGAAMGLVQTVPLFPLFPVVVFVFAMVILYCVGWATALCVQAITGFDDTQRQPVSRSCLNCGYSLANLGHGRRCPECGHEMSKAQFDELQFDAAVASPPRKSPTDTPKNTP